jgi:hypothetical protein
MMMMLRAPWGGANGILGGSREGEGACQELWLPEGGSVWAGWLVHKDTNICGVAAS